MNTDAARDELRRLLIAGKDLQDARDYGLFLERGDHERTPDSYLVRKAVNSAMIVAYTRPFLDGRQPKDTSVPHRIAGRYLRRLTSEERALHDRLIADRHEGHAHSDAVRHNVEFVYAAMFGRLAAQSNDPTAPMNITDVKTLLSIIQKVREAMTERTMELHQKLHGGRD